MTLKMLHFNSHNVSTAALGAGYSIGASFVAADSLVYRLVYPIVAALVTKMLYDMGTWVVEYLKAKASNQRTPSLVKLKAEIVSDAIDTADEVVKKLGK